MQPYTGVNMGKGLPVAHMTLTRTPRGNAVTHGCHTTSEGIDY